MSWVHVSQVGELSESEAVSAHRYRKIKLEIQEVQGRNCLSDFHGMSLTRDKQMQMVRKWHTLIEAHTKVKTTDGYILRMFCMAFTKRRQEQVKNTCYAGSAQIRKIRKKMVEVMQKEASKSMLRDLVKKLIPEALGKEIEKVTRGTYPIQNCLIRKVKMVRHFMGRGKNGTKGLKC